MKSLFKVQLLWDLIGMRSHGALGMSSFDSEVKYRPEGSLNLG